MHLPAHDQGVLFDRLSVIQYHRGVIPAPADHLEVSEIGLP